VAFLVLRNRKAFFADLYRLGTLMTPGSVSGRAVQSRTAMMLWSAMPATVLCSGDLAWTTSSAVRGRIHSPAAAGQVKILEN